MTKGLSFARYLNTAAGGVFRAMLGKRYDEVVARAYLSPDHDLSYQTTVFAEIDDRIVGMASGYTAEEHRRWTDAPLTRAAGVRMLRMAFLSFLGRDLLAFIDSVPEGDFYLQALAIDDDMRGNGIGSILLGDMERRARATDSLRIALDVDVGNDGAKRLYKRRGFVVEGRSPPIRFARDTGVFRMIKSL